jgi:Wzt C-terminal domain
LRVNETPFASAVKPGDVVGVRMVIQCEAARESLLFGYLVRDKMGTAIFGENSARVANGVVTAGAGQSEAAFEFTWPEVQPGEYFLTLGVGEGRDAVRHRIQCWAHNLHLFNAISPARPVHCLFNNALRDFTFSARAEEPVAMAIS